MAVNADIAVTSNPAGTTTEKIRAQRAKRVDRACENCRRKRLKCATDQHPCPNCVLYSVDCIYTPNPRTRTVNSLQKSTIRARKRKQSQGDTIIVCQDIDVRPSERGLQAVAQEGVPLSNGEVIQQQTEQTPCQNRDEGMHVILQQQDSVDFDPSTMDDLMMSDIDEMNQMVIEDFDGMAEFLRRDPQQQDPLSTLSSPVGGTSPCLSIPSGGSQMNSQLTDEMGDGGVDGLQYFISDSGRLPDTECIQSIPPGLMVKKDSASGKFIGINSTGATVASSLRHSISEVGAIQEFDVLSYLIGAVSHVDEVGLTPSTSNSEYKLPDQALARHGIEGFFRNIHVLYPILNAKNFLHDWFQFYDVLPPKHDPILYSRFFLIVAIGSLSQPLLLESDASTEAFCQGLQQQAWRMLHDVLARPYIASVQVLLLHVMYLIHFSKSGMAWVLCGLAIQIAQSVGLHRQVLPDMGLSEEEVRVRSLICWVCYTLDAFLSATQGRPPAVSNALCDVELLPLLKNPDSPDDGTPRPAAEIYYWHVKLAQIENSFCNLFSSAQTVAARVNEVANLDTALGKWRDEIPMEYRPDQEILADHDMYQHIAMIHLQYFNILRAIHWTLLSSIQNHGFTPNLHSNPRIRSGEAICVASARSFIKILNDMSHELGREAIIPICFHTDHYMAAISILFHNIFKYPHKHSARADLEILRAGQYHFERHVHPLRFNSQLKSLFQKMQTAAEELVSKSSSLHSSTNADRFSISNAERLPSHGDAKSPGLSVFESIFSPRFLSFSENQIGAMHSEIRL